jgi:putative transposase
MPRKPRLDVEGTLHHVIVRGIERSDIFKDNDDRKRFTERLGGLVNATGMKIYAWALIPNHFHLLFHSGPPGLPTFMRRLLTGYAVTFNRRHHRCGHLFQNRYKSIVCQEEPYFLELVRYIHLNPLRSSVVSTLQELETYPWSGHKTLLGKANIAWQDCDSVLLRFGNAEKTARTAYRRFIEHGVSQGHRPELTGGGLLRSLRSREDALGRGNKDRVLTDERILGAGEFVQTLIEKAGKEQDNVSLSGRIEKMREMINERCRAEGISVEALTGGSRAGTIPRLRSELVFCLANEVGLCYAEIARNIGISRAGVGRIIERGRRQST